MSRTAVLLASVPCDCCNNQLLESEARLSVRALNACLCWRCRARLGSLPSVHQAPPGCSVLVTGTGYGLWNAVLTVPDGREFEGSAWTDHQALSAACAQARAAGSLS